MYMKRWVRLAILATFILSFLLLTPQATQAVVEAAWPAGKANICRNPGDAFMNFEGGTDGQKIESTVPGMRFITSEGLDWVYGDIRTGKYNVYPYGHQGYECNGNFFAWLGVTGDWGRIDFAAPATYFSVLVSTYSGVKLEAYDADGNFLATSGWATNNIHTRTFTRLTVEAPEGKTIAYIMVHDTGNYWLIDDICTDVSPECKIDIPRLSQCDPSWKYDTYDHSPDAVAVVKVKVLNLRSQPIIDEENVLEELKKGDILTIIGWTETGDWLKVIAPSKQQGWVYAELCTINNTICNYGCALTSATMILNYYGKPYGLQTDPSKLNEWLNHHFYDMNGNGKLDHGEPTGYTDKGDLNWKIVAEYFNDVHGEGVISYNGRKDIYKKTEETEVEFEKRTKEWRKQVDAILNGDLCDQRPVILKVPYEPWHFVVATEKTTIDSTQTWTINDPGWWKNRQSLLSYDNQYFGMRRYVPRVDDNSAITIEAYSPVEIYVIDPQGRRLGKDPVTGQEFDEIPNGGYYTDTSFIDGSKIKTIEILKPADGDYAINVIGTDIGSYVIDYSGYDESGDWSGFETFTGETTCGEIHVCNINYSSVANQPPLANADGPYIGDEGSPLTLDASGSYDPDGSISLYEWDFDSDGIYETSSASSNITHTWHDDYNGTVTLRVTDDDGLTGVNTAEVTVNNVPPMVEAGPNMTAECCVDEISLNATFGDPGWLDSHAASIDWGDGTVEAGTVDEIERTVSGSHKYCATGNYTITLNVTDDDGGIGVDEAAVTVVDTTPPEVEIEVPMEHAALQDGVILTATASDLCGVGEAYFYVREPDGANGVDIGYEELPATLNSISSKWEYSFDTTQIPDGYYVILAKAVDNSSNEGWSEVVPCSIRNWAVLELLPASQSNKGGRTMPVKFSLRIAESVDTAQPFVYNEELEIRIYDQMKPGSILQTSLYADTSRDYRIDSVGEQYITNFKTKKQPATYTVEIWRTSKNFLIGSFTFETVK